MRALLAFAVAAALAGCGTAAGHHDGGGGNGGSGGGADLMSSTSDMALACTMPGPCANNTGVCCVRSIGAHESVFCDTTRCPLEHGVDVFQSPLCTTVADCYKAARHDFGTLYCCPDPTFGSASVKTCRFSACP